MLGYQAAPAGDITRQVPGRTSVQVYADGKLVVRVVRFGYQRCYRQGPWCDTGRRGGDRVLIERLADNGHLEVPRKPGWYDASSRDGYASGPVVHVT